MNHFEKKETFFLTAWWRADWWTKMETAGWENQWPEESDFGKLTWHGTFRIPLPYWELITLCNLSLAFQEVKKEQKSLEDLYERLEFIQVTWKDQGVVRGIKKEIWCDFLLQACLIFVIVASGAACRIGPVPFCCGRGMCETGPIYRPNKTGNVEWMHTGGSMRKSPPQSGYTIKILWYHWVDCTLLKYSKARNVVLQKLPQWEEPTTSYLK